MIRESHCLWLSFFLIYTLFRVKEHIAFWKFAFSHFLIYF